MAITLTPAQCQVLDLYSLGTKTSQQIGTALGFSRQRADEILTALRRKGVIISDPSDHAHTRESHPPDSRTNPWPPTARRAQQGVLVLRSTVPPREDGLDLTEGAIPDERLVVWSYSGAPPRCRWSWTASRFRPWSLTDTWGAYADWCLWLSTSQTPGDSWLTLPVLDSKPCYSLAELTRTLAWVIGVEGLLYPAVDDPGPGVQSSPPQHSFGQ